MRLNKYISSLFLLVFPLCCKNTEACGPFYYPPGEYLMLRVESHMDEDDEKTENCKLWQQQTSIDVPLDDIYNVVYKFTIQVMEKMLLGKYEGDNKFARWLVTRKDKEAIEYLILAKQYEQLSRLMTSPWYYPFSKEDPNADTIIHKAKAYKGHRLKERYALQTIRGMYVAKQHEDCIAYWDSISPHLKDCVIKEMALDYVCGSHSHIGQWETALDYYTRKGDLNSMRFILNKYSRMPEDEFVLYEKVYAACPKSGQLLSVISDYLVSNEKYYPNFNKEYIDKLLKFTAKVAQEGKAKELATWCYLAAYLANVNADAALASRLLALAERHPHSPYMDASIRVFRMYIDAKVSTYNEAYEQKLFNQLKWLDSQIVGNLSEEIILHEYQRWEMNSGISYYYWNDMLRRIIFSEVCPRMMKGGQYVKALQLANVADNYLFLLCDKEQYLNTLTPEKQKYHHDLNEDGMHRFDSHFFGMMDTMEVRHLEKYLHTLQQPTTSFDRFLCERSYRNWDYFYDIIGTKYLRMMDYDRAEHYLSKVTPAYQDQLHTKNYFRRDPFAIQKKNNMPFMDYKYNFAREMKSLMREIRHTSNPNRKGLLMMRYALGIHNSFSFCWPLTHYGKQEDNGNGAYNHNTWMLYPNLQYVREEVQSLHSRANRIMTDPECKARAEAMWLNFKTVATFYPETETGKRIRGACDKYTDYYLFGKK